ncbi:hypothetical protein, partial [Streptococcus macedonicus]
YLFFKKVEEDYLVFFFCFVLFRFLVVGILLKSYRAFLSCAVSNSSKIMLTQADKNYFVLDI